MIRFSFMNFVNEYHKYTYHRIKHLYYILMLFCLIFVVPGCKTISPESKYLHAEQEQRVYKLRNLSGLKCMAILTKLGFSDFSKSGDPNTIIVKSTSELLNKANTVVDLIDTKEEYAVVNLGDASNVRNLPSNSRLALALGDINIGTFSQPPRKGRNSRAVIDILGGSVFAVIPAGCQKRFSSLLSTPSETSKTSEISAVSVSGNTAKSGNAVEDANIPVEREQQSLTHSNSNIVYEMSEMETDEDINSQKENIQAETGPATDVNIPKTVTIIFKPAKDVSEEPNNINNRAIART